MPTVECFSVSGRSQRGQAEGGGSNENGSNLIQIHFLSECWFVGLQALHGVFDLSLSLSVSVWCFLAVLVFLFWFPVCLGLRFGNHLGVFSGAERFALTQGEAKEGKSKEKKPKVEIKDVSIASYAKKCDVLSAADAHHSYLCR